MLNRIQIWAQLAHAANKLPQVSAIQKAKWDVYNEALVLIGPAPLVLLDQKHPWGRLVHPELGDPATIPGVIKG